MYKVYVVCWDAVSDLIDPNTNVEDFKREAMRQDHVYSLEEFERMFNGEHISVHTHSIKIIYDEKVSSHLAD